MERFLRTELLIGKKKLQKITQSTVTVIGLGAVGSYAVEALARAGVGRLRLYDFDDIKMSNMNRQLYALGSTIGQSKAQLARARVREINPACTVEAFNTFAAADAIDSVLAVVPDIVIDAIDSVNPKVQVLSVLHRRGIPVVSSMGAALRTDPTAIHAGDLFKTRGCPLAKQLRKRLRKYDIHEGIFCVYSKEHTVDGTWADEELSEEVQSVRGRKRKALGSLSTIPGVFGLLVAHYALEQLCGGFSE